MPAASLMRITSSPAEGLLVVPSVTVPVRVAANRHDVLARRRKHRVANASLGDSALPSKSAPILKFFASSRLGPQPLRIPDVRLLPGLLRLLLQESFSSPDNQP